MKDDELRYKYILTVPWIPVIHFFGLNDTGSLFALEWWTLGKYLDHLGPASFALLLSPYQPSSHIISDQCRLKSLSLDIFVTSTFCFWIFSLKGFFPQERPLHLLILHLAIWLNCAAIPVCTLYPFNSIQLSLLLSFESRFMSISLTCEDALPRRGRRWQVQQGLLEQVGPKALEAQRFRVELVGLRVAAGHLSFG